MWHRCATCLLGRALYKRDLADFPPCAEGAGCGHPIRGQEEGKRRPRTSHGVSAHATGRPLPQTQARGSQHPQEAGAEKATEARSGQEEQSWPEPDPWPSEPTLPAPAPPPLPGQGQRRRVAPCVAHSRRESGRDAGVSKPQLRQALAPPLLSLPGAPRQPLRRHSLWHGAVAGTGQANAKGLPASPPIPAPRAPEGQEPRRARTPSKVRSRKPPHRKVGVGWRP